MKSVTIRGRSMSAVMQRVADELGEDALILSSQQTAAGVEIVAVAPEHATSFESTLAAQRDRPVARGPARPRRQVRPDLADRLGGWPVLDEETLAALRERAEADGGLIEDFIATLAGDLAHAALRLPRVVICGPHGAGKARLAIQLAVQRAVTGGRVRVCLVGYEDADATAFRLAGAARGLDVRSHRDPGEIDSAAPDAELIIAVAAACPTDDVALIVAATGAQPLLALPAGQHPRTVAAAAARWSEVLPAVVLTGAEDAAPWPEELAALAAHGLPIAAAPGLRQLDRGCLEAWARRWLRQSTEDSAEHAEEVPLGPVFVSCRGAGRADRSAEKAEVAPPAPDCATGTGGADAVQASADVGRTAEMPCYARESAGAPASPAPVSAAKTGAGASPATRRTRWPLPLLGRRGRVTAPAFEQPA